MNSSTDVKSGLLANIGVFADAVYCIFPTARDDHRDQQ